MSYLKLMALLAVSLWSYQAEACSTQVLVSKLCASQSETQVSKLNLPMQESKLFESPNSPKSKPTQSVVSGLTGQRVQLNTLLWTSQNNSMEVSSLLGSRPADSITQLQLPEVDSFLITYKLLY